MAVRSTLGVFFLIVVAMVCGAGGAGATDIGPLKGPIQAKQLQSLLLKKYRADPRVASATPFGVAGIDITLKEGRRCGLGLSNLLDSLNAKGVDRAAAAEPYERGFERLCLAPHRSETAGKLDLDRVVAVVRSRAYVAEVEAKAGSSGKTHRAVWRPLAGDLVVMVALDLPDAFAVLFEDNPGVAAMGPEPLFDIGLENTQARFTKVPLARIGPLFVAATGDDYESALLLEPLFWEKFEATYIKDVLVAVPNRGTLAIGSAGDALQVEALRQIAAMAGDHPLSAHLYRRKGRDWVVAD